MGRGREGGAPHCRWFKNRLQLVERWGKGTLSVVEINASRGSWLSERERGGRAT